MPRAPSPVKPVDEPAPADEAAPVSEPAPADERASLAEPAPADAFDVLGFERRPPAAEVHVEVTSLGDWKIRVAIQNVLKRPIRIDRELSVFFQWKVTDSAGRELRSDSERIGDRKRRDLARFVAVEPGQTFSKTVDVRVLDKFSWAQESVDLEGGGTGHLMHGDESRHRLRTADAQRPFRVSVQLDSDDVMTCDGFYGYLGSRPEELAGLTGLKSNTSTATLSE